MTCPSLSNITHGHVTQSGDNYGDVVSVVCDVGYEVLGSDTIQCNSSGVWNSTVPSCEPVKCPKLDNIAHGHFEPNGGTGVFEDILRVVCDDGYKIEGSEALLCNSSGLWNSTVPSCEPLKCPTLDNVTHGHFVQNGGISVFGSTVSVACDAGYQIHGQGQDSLYCNSSGLWNSTVPNCDPVICPSLDNVTHGHFKQNTHGHYVQNGGIGTFGDTVSVVCDTGYQIHGDEVLRCNSSGLWNTTIPTCDPLKCPRLDNSEEPTWS